MTDTNASETDRLKELELQRKRREVDAAHESVNDVLKQHASDERYKRLSKKRR